MALVIDDGDPWWLSPNVWTVDQSNPNDPSPGVSSPIVGDPYLLKALVRNDARVRVDNARVDFFWADPSIGITRMNANSIGSAFVTVEAAATAECLSLVTWTSTFMNGGHVCVVAAVVPPGGTPTNALDAVNDARVAQRNLDLVVATQGQFAIVFDVCNTTREAGEIEISLQEVGAETLEVLGIKGAAGLDSVTVLGYSKRRDAGPEGAREDGAPLLKLESLACAGMTLFGELGAETAAFSVVGRIGRREIGAFTAVVMQKGGQAS